MAKSCSIGSPGACLPWQACPPVVGLPALVGLPAVASLLLAVHGVAKAAERSEGTNFAYERNARKFG